MIGYIKGPFTRKTPTYVYLEKGGIGYHINVSLHTFSQIEQMSEGRLWIMQLVRQDRNSSYGTPELYGFFDEDERALFLHLISVSGVGFNTARIVLSSLTPAEVREAILSEDELTFKRVKGIGSKTAKQIILDLKNKVEKGPGLIASSASVTGNSLRGEALSALIALGFDRNKVTRVLNQLDQTSQAETVESMIKAALKKLSS